MAVTPSPLVLGIGWNFGVSQGSIRAALSIAGTPVTSGTVDQAYTGFTVTASGGLAPYTYIVASGALPTGLALDPTTGAVAGTPTLEETQTGIVIRAVDRLFATADLAPFDIAVSGAAGNEITFMGEVVTFDGEPVTFTPPEIVTFAGSPVTFDGAPITFT